MMRTCPFCGTALPAHVDCCRVPGELERFERVYQRLNDERRNEFLRDNLVRYLAAFGRRDIGAPPHRPDAAAAPA